jgi:transposase-like protein
MRKKYDSKFKSRVTLEAMRGDRTIAEIAGILQKIPFHQCRSNATSELNEL